LNWVESPTRSSVEFDYSTFNVKGPFTVSASQTGLNDAEIPPVLIGTKQELPGFVRDKFTLTEPLPVDPLRPYVEVTVNSDGKVPESNRSNNTKFALISTGDEVPRDENQGPVTLLVGEGSQSWTLYGLTYHGVAVDAYVGIGQQNVEANKAAAGYVGVSLSKPPSEVLPYILSGKLNDISSTIGDTITGAPSRFGSRFVFTPPTVVGFFDGPGYVIAIGPAGWWRKPVAYSPEGPAKMPFPHGVPPTPVSNGTDGAKPAPPPSNGPTGDPGRNPNGGGPAVDNGAPGDNGAGNGTDQSAPPVDGGNTTPVGPTDVPNVTEDVPDVPANNGGITDQGVEDPIANRDPGLGAAPVSVDVNDNPNQVVDDLEKARQVVDQLFAKSGESVDQAIADALFRMTVDNANQVSQDAPNGATRSSDDVYPEWGREHLFGLEGDPTINLLHRQELPNVSFTSGGGDDSTLDEGRVDSALIQPDDLLGLFALAKDIPALAKALPDIAKATAELGAQAGTKVADAISAFVAAATKAPSAEDAAATVERGLAELQDTLSEVQKAADEANAAEAGSKAAETGATITASRRQIVDDLLETAQSRVKSIQSIDPDAQVGFRGSLARGMKGSHKGNAPFDPNSFDVDAFIVSDSLAEQIGQGEKFRWGNKIPEVNAIQKDLDSALRNLPSFDGMRGDRFQFRIFTHAEMDEILQKGDSQIYILPGR
jgi:hypothetical protein